MAGYGKHSHDSGRARYHRFRDREQLEFDDMLIGDFLEANEDPRDNALAQVPVRYGGARLRDLSDSAIAGAMLDAGVFEQEYEHNIIRIHADIGATMNALLESEETATAAQIGISTDAEGPRRTQPAAVPLKYHNPPVIRPMRVMVTSARRTRDWSIRKFAQGFLIGAACTGAAIGGYSLIF